MFGVGNNIGGVKKVNGSIYDPTKLQFPSRGNGVYEEFDGLLECSECGEIVKEEDAKFIGRYACCSDRCCMKLVGLEKHCKDLEEF